jgi:2-hydroxy-6-oxonona-2,4-dienedioate hydrolase
VPLALALALAAGLALKGGDKLCPNPALPPTRPHAVAATPFEQKDVVVDGVRLRYIDVGSGPVLLLIPGLTSRVEEFDAMTGELSKSFRVLAFDFPGSGYSDKPVRDYSVKYYEDSALAFLDKLGVQKCYLAGGSLGGNMVLRLALRAPERFPKIVSWAPASSWAPHRALEVGGHVVSGYAMFWPMVKVQSRYWYSDDFAGREKLLSDTFAYYREVMSPGFLRMYWDLANEQIGSSLQSVAAGIKQPVLLVWGDRDDGGGMAAGVAKLKELIPNSKLLVFPNAKHSLAAERPKELVSAIQEFIGDTSRFSSR